MVPRWGEGQLCGWVRNVEKLDNFIQNTNDQHGWGRCWKVDMAMSCGRTPCICPKAKLACDSFGVLVGRVPNPEFQETTFVNPSLGFRRVCVHCLLVARLPFSYRPRQSSSAPLWTGSSPQVWEHTSIHPHCEKAEGTVCIREPAAWVNSEERVLWRGALSSATETEHGSSWKLLRKINKQALTELHTAGSDLLRRQKFLPLEDKKNWSRMEKKTGLFLKMRWGWGMA